MRGLHCMLKFFAMHAYHYISTPKLVYFTLIRGGVMIEFSEMRGPHKIFGPFCKINGQNILFGPLISENSIVTPPLVTGFGKVKIK